MSCAAAAIPRKILPPPSTSPICTPAFATSATSLASDVTRSVSRPKESGPAKASPLILRSIRRNCGMNSPLVMAVRSPQLLCYRQRALLNAGSIGCIPDFEAHELPDLDCASQLRTGRANQLGDGDGVLSNK